jgi:hypothetical protein
MKYIIWCAFGIVDVDIFIYNWSNFKKIDYYWKLYASYFKIEGVFQKIDVGLPLPQFLKKTFLKPLAILAEQILCHLL